MENTCITVGLYNCKKHRGVWDKYIKLCHFS
jgi:hypothetical protein